MEESNDKKGEEEKLEDKKKINEIKDESEDTKKNESKDNDNSGKIPFEVTKEQEKFLLETLKKMKLSKNINQEDGEEIKSEYKFWGTQPVPQFNKECPTKFGEIWTDHKIENLEKDSLSLPEGYEWKDVNLNQQVDLDKLYEFLKSNYVEDEDHMFRFDYSKDFLKWHLNPPGFYSEWSLGVLWTVQFSSHP